MGGMQLFLLVTWRVPAKLLEDIINEKPTIIKEDDVCIKNPYERNSNLSKWEIEGMIQCLVDL